MGLADDFHVIDFAVLEAIHAESFFPCKFNEDDLEIQAFKKTLREFQKMSGDQKLDILLDISFVNFWARAATCLTAMQGST